MSRHSPGTLDRKFAGGLAWTAGVKYSTQLVTWAALVVTARLLSPAEFGISEMASVFVVITGVLAEFGVGTAVLQMQELQDDTLRQMHTFSCALGTVAFGVLLVFIPWLTEFFNLPNLGLLFAANGLAFFVTGFQAVPTALLQRDLDYRRISLAEATQVILQSAVTVAAASAGWGYWSLTAGAVAGKVTAAVMVNLWKPVSFARVHWPQIRVAASMGRQVSIGRLAWSAYIQADAIVIGRVLGQSSLGVYRMAMNLAAAPAEKTSGLLMRATGPLFARVQSDLALMRRYYLILIEMLILSILPLMLGLGLVAQEAVAIILEPKWLAATVPVQWLCVYMTLRPLGTLAEQVLISKRQTRFTMNVSVLSFCVMPIAFYIAARFYGSEGVAAAWLLLTPVTLFPMMIRSLSAVQLSFRDFLDAAWPALAGVSAMIPAVYFFRLWMLGQGWATPIVLAAEVTAGGLVYGAVLFGFFRARLARYYRFAKDLRG